MDDESGPRRRTRMTGALCAAGRTAGVTAGRRCARSMRRLIIHQLLDEHHIKSTSRKDGRQAGEGTQDPQRMQQICETDRHDKRQMTKFRDGRVDPPSLLDVWALGIWALGVSINQPACTHNKRLGTCATRASPSNLTNIIKTWSNFLHSALRKTSARSSSRSSSAIYAANAARAGSEA